MKFVRFARYEPVTMTSRKQAAFARKQAKEQARYPLFADEVAAQQIDLQTEQAKRQSRVESFEANMRAFHARVWREARSLYFRQPADLRASIRAAWNAWTGPLTALYFSSMVDSMSGEQARRVARIQAEHRPLIEAALARRRTVETLPLF